MSQQKLPLNLGGQGLVCVRALHATVPRHRFQWGGAAETLVEEDAAVCRHLLDGRLPSGGQTFGCATFVALVETKDDARGFAGASEPPANGPHNPTRTGGFTRSDPDRASLMEPPAPAA